ncbi:MAG TPA: hypothetical protein VKU01_13090 [Bryobacteraceae bacterium]|nr:hypothetical protein [Bryobacteraceae bacterium]
MKSAIQPARVAAFKAASAASTVLPSSTGPTVRLQYAGTAPIRVRGPETGQTYEFSAANPEVEVDRRDAAGLIRVGLFRAAGT